MLQIWRMSISKLREYSNVDVGTIHNNRIKSYLLDRNIKLKGDEYPIVIQYALESHLRGLILNFGLNRDNNGIPFYLVKMGLFIYLFYIKSSNHSLSKPIQEIYIKSEKILIIPAVEKIKKLIRDTMIDTVKKAEKKY